ncbi:MarR family winged helix-turn-helix transcriptional regulator [Clostridium oceanicum]|uniref:MarR family transcriptional regulator n=1 Tax=Clostridium oceanicum TaxID=1543 RepID=A0ABN1J8X3_9CLOT
MKKSQVNDTSKELYNLLLSLHKKIFNLDEMMKNLSVPPSHAKVMFFLHKNGSSYISETAKKLMISKPNMTPIIEKLTSESLIRRYEDSNDRRILRIELTDNGKKFIKKQELSVRDSLSQKISHLEDEDLISLRNHITEIENIITKIV